MKSKTFATLFGVLTIVAIFGAASEITAMTASAELSVQPGRHCTASQPCVQICGDHVCAPGELAQLTAPSSPTPSNNTGTSTTPSSVTASKLVLLLEK